MALFSGATSLRLPRPEQVPPGRDAVMPVPAASVTFTVHVLSPRVGGAGSAFTNVTVYASPVFAKPNA